MTSGDKSSSKLGNMFEVEQELFQFISTRCKDELMQILKDPRELIHYPLLVSYVDLNAECGRTPVALLRYPDKVLPSGDRAAYRAQLSLYESYENKEELKIKRHIHLRIYQIPDGIDRYMTAFPGSDEAGTFMTLLGTVGKTSRAGPREFKREYKCNKCKQITTMLAPKSRYYQLPKSIDQCENLCVGAKVEACETGVDGLTVKDAHRFKDYQEIKVQEQITQSDTGSIQNTLWVVLEDDLVDSCKPGDDVLMTGTLYSRFRPFRVNQPIDVDLAFMANHVEVKNDQRTSVLLNDRVITFFQAFWKHYDDNPFEGRNVILRSFCPQVYGMYLIKLAMSVVLAGGVSKEESGSRVRGESHLLLVGDPGTGKSQLLKYAANLTPRSVFTTGTGTSSAGLTVAAVKENGTWNLEAGALVLADGGVCCIDEFSNIKEHDRISIHEAMEQQTISIAKAGMVSKLSTKCTIIAATNPKFSKYDQEEDIEMNVGLPSPLLSRFDLVIVLKDAFCEAWDELLCDFVLGDTNVFEMAAKNAMAGGTIWDTDTLQSYMVLIKEKEPQITEDAERILSRYYHLQRNSATRNVARTTVRLFESLFRLAEGHARLMFRDCVLVHDAIIAISLVETSMQSSALTESLPNPLHIEFPKNAFDEYYNQAKKILELLNLPDLWRTEKIYLDNLRIRQSKSKSKDSRPPPPPFAPSNVSIPQSSQKNPQSTNTSEDPKVIFETPTSNSVNEIRSQIVPFGPGVPEDFFEADGDDQMPCSLRIVTSTQNPSQEGNVRDNAAATGEALSPIAPVSTRFLNVLKFPSESSKSGDKKGCMNTSSVGKRKRSAPKTEKCEEDIENIAENKFPAAPKSDTDSGIFSGSVSRQAATRFNLSRFRKEDD